MNTRPSSSSNDLQFGAQEWLIQRAALPRRPPSMTLPSLVSKMNVCCGIRRIAVGPLADDLPGRALAAILDDQRALADRRCGEYAAAVDGGVANASKAVVSCCWVIGMDVRRGSRRQSRRRERSDSTRCRRPARCGAPVSADRRKRGAKTPVAREAVVEAEFVAALGPHQRDERSLVGAAARLRDPESARRGAQRARTRGARLPASDPGLRPPSARATMRIAAASRRRAIAAETPADPAGHGVAQVAGLAIGYRRRGEARCRSR